MAKGEGANGGFTRRTLLKATGWTLGGLTVAVFGIRQVWPPLPSFNMPDENAGTAWLQIREDGRCLMFYPRAEMGQNASTGLMQIVAEELNLSPSDIEMKFPTTTRDIPPTLITAGSRSIALYAQPVARAAATLRETLRSMAAKKLGVDPSHLRDSTGGFVDRDGTVLGYAELVEGKALVLEADTLPDAPLYTFDRQRPHRHVGKPVAPAETVGLVTGAPVFAADIILEGSVFGRAVQPPTREAKLVSVDDAGARQVPGLIDVLVDRENNFVGVLGETPGAVDRAHAALQVSWDIPPGWSQVAMDELLDIDRNLARGPLENSLLEGTHDDAGPWDLDLRFDVQAQSHAMQETRTAVVRMIEGGETAVELWTGTQDPFYIQRVIADQLGISEDRVVVHAMRMGGGFGGREHPEVELDALRLAAATDRPVKVQWRREDEFRAARNRPGSSHRIRLRADGDDKLTSWAHNFVSGHIAFARGRLPGPLLSFARLVAGDLGAARGAKPPYASASKQVAFSDVDLPIDLGSWRSLGGATNTFVIECAVDELARLRGRDPVDFRLENIPGEHARLGRCLEQTRALSSMSDLPTAQGYGRGFACGIYEEHSFVAASADLFVDPGTGEIQVLRMCCVQDVGLAINPDQLRAQVEGNLVWGLGMALMEKVELGKDDIRTTNFDSYLIPRMSHTPAFEIDIVNNPAYPPAGAGEAALIVAAPAIANAVRDATGVRITALPIRPGSPALS